MRPSAPPYESQSSVGRLNQMSTWPGSSRALGSIWPVRVMECYWGMRFIPIVKMNHTSNLNGGDFMDQNKASCELIRFDDRSWLSASSIINALKIPEAEHVPCSV